MDRRSISATDVISVILYGQQVAGFDFPIEYRNTILKDLRITGKLEIDAKEQNQDQLGERGTIFKDCIFTDDFFITACNIHLLHFTNCLFEGKLILYSITGLVFRFENCIFQYHIDVDSKDLGYFKLINPAINDRIIITGHYKNISISGIQNGHEDKAATNHLSIRMVNAGDLYLDHVQIEEIILDRVSLTQANFKNVTSSFIKLDDVTITQELILRKVSLSSFILHNITIKGFPQRRMLITDKSSIDTILLQLDKLDNTRIDSSYIGIIKLQGTNPDSSIFAMESVQYNKLFFDEVYNKGSIALKDIKRKDIQAEIILCSSNLGKTDFINCKFSNEKLRFHNSKMTDIFISDSDFPRLVYEMETDKPDHIQAKLAFGQLHTALNKQGDTVRALEYQSREIAAHYQTLWWFNRQRPWFNFTKLNLWLNWISNNYGRDWVLGGLFTIGVGLLFYTLLLISTDRYQFGIPHIDWSLLPGFLKFMNPIRFFDLELLFTNDDKFSSLRFSPWSYLWDFLGRIFLAYGFYQTIQAFRRYGRK